LKDENQELEKNLKKKNEEFEKMKTQLEEKHKDILKMEEKLKEEEKLRQDLEREMATKRTTYHPMPEFDKVKSKILKL
jgi:chromosome segregation ATPase